MKNNDRKGIPRGRIVSLEGVKRELNSKSININAFHKDIAILS